MRWQYAILLIILLTFPLASAFDYCIERDPTGLGYICYSDDSAVGGLQGGVTDICTWCLNPTTGLNHPECRADAALPNQCVQSCCCDAQDNPLYTGQKSTQYCLDQGGTPRELESYADCTASCTSTSSGGTGDDPQEVDGLVLDAGNNNEGLAGATIRYPHDGSLRQVLSQAGGTFHIDEVDPGSQILFATLSGCGSDQKTILVDGASINDITFTLDCSSGGCVGGAINTTKAEPIQGSHEVDISWDESTCAEQISGFIIKRCKVDDINTQACTEDKEVVAYITDPTQTSYADTDFKERQAYCYFVDLQTTSGPTIEDATEGGACVTPMWEMCMNGVVPTTGKCFNDASDITEPLASIDPFTGGVTCDANNAIIIGASDCTGNPCVCSSGTFCRYDRVTEEPSCQPIADCAICNGLFGAFITPTMELPEEGASCEESQLCVLGNYGNSFDIYSSCREISSCLDYRTEERCNEGNDAAVPYDVCGVSNGGCEWVALPGLEELAGGLCREIGTTQGEDDLACEYCDDFFGAFCNKTTCAELGDCYYNTVIPGYPLPGESTSSCLPKSSMACRFYDTQEDCEGTPPQPVSVDVTYDNAASLDAIAQAGSNARTESKDFLGLGTCKWITDVYPPGSHGYCVKNANQINALVPFTEPRHEDDCFEYDKKNGESLGETGQTFSTCFKDNEAPETLLFLSEGEYVVSSRFYSDPPGINFDVSDNLFTRGVKTYFCLADKGATCYPTSALNQIGRDKENNTPYALYYYSVDPAGNLEEVQEVNITLVSDSSPHLTAVEVIS